MTAPIIPFPRAATNHPQEQSSRERFAAALIERAKKQGIMVSRDQAMAAIIATKAQMHRDGKL